MPDDFEISRTRIETSQLEKLDPSQRKIYDSIINYYYSSPRKVVYDSQKGRLYSITLNYGEVIQFRKLDSTLVRKDEIYDLNIISLDSAIDILAPKLSSLGERQDRIFNTEYIFHIIDMNSGLNKIPIYTTQAIHLIIH
jgi:hypothetical protein